MSQRGSARNIILILVLVLMAAALAGYFYLRDEGKAGSKAGQQTRAQKPVAVTVARAEQKDVPLYLTAIGTVVARNAVQVQPQVGGRLLSIDFIEGEPVAEGAVLAQIDPRNYQAVVNEAAARIRQNEAELATARTDLARFQELIKKNYVSRQELDTQGNVVKQLQAAIAAGKASLATAELDLDYTQVKSPIAGIAGIRQVDVGNVLTTADVIVTINQVYPVDVVFALPGKELDSVRRGQARGALTVLADSRSEHAEIARNGTLRVIDNRIDADSGTFTLKAEFPNDDDALWPGQFVNVKLKVDTVTDGLVIPVQAVERGPDGEYVYVLQDDDTVAVRPVTIAGEVDDTHVLIGAGIEADDELVTEGQFRLRPGSRVKPVSAAEFEALDDEQAPVPDV